MPKTNEPATDTWYVLEDGATADPADVSPDDKGMLRTKAGVAVAMRGDHPHTTGNKDRPNPNKKAAEADTSQPGYKTRESKAK